MIKSNRSITSVIIILAYAVVLSLTILVHEIFFDIFVLLLMIAASLEVSKALKNKFSKPLDFFIILYIIFGYVIFKVTDYFMVPGTGGIIWYFAAFIFIAAVAVIYCMFSKKAVTGSAMTSILVMVYPVTFLVYMLGLNYLPGAENLNITGILLMIFVATFTDTAAFLVGSLLKGPKLCPSISPKKTISGAVGGLIGGILGGAVILLFAVYDVAVLPALSQSVPLNVMHYLLIGLFGSAFTQFGDLTASYFKRRCDIKDFGKILPGHGGIMDRIDGMIFLSAFIYIYLTALFAF